MKVENAPTVDPQVAALVESGKAVEETPGGDSTVKKCPLQEKHEEPEKKPPLRLLLWNIQELGGGFYQPHVRATYVMEAYAELIRKLEIDIAVILGITDTIGVVPETEGTGETRYVEFDKTLKDTGVAEVRKLAGLLGGGWQVLLPKPKSGEGYLYHYRTTTAILWNSANGISLGRSGLAESALDRTAGLTGRLFFGEFDAAKYTAKKVFVAGPLGTIGPERPWAVPAEPAPESELATVVPLPETAMVGASGSGNLAASSAFSGFKAEVDAEYRPPGKDGTLLKDTWWFPKAETDDGILDNFDALDPGNSLLQDEEMHWEAMEEPKHEKELEEVMGVLQDNWLLRHTGADGGPAVEELRVVDLIAAAMAADVLGKARPVKPENSKEDSAIAGKRKAYRGEVGDEEWRDGVENEISDCAHFSRLLCEHWPVVMQLRFPK